MKRTFKKALLYIILLSATPFWIVGWVWQFIYLSLQSGTIWCDYALEWVGE